MIHVSPRQNKKTAMIIRKKIKEMREKKKKLLKLQRRAKGDPVKQGKIKI